MAGVLTLSVGIGRNAFYSSAVIAITSTASIVAIFVGIRRHRPQVPLFWRVTAAALSAGILAGGLGIVLDDTLVRAIAIDATYVVGYSLFVVAGLLLLPRGRGRHDWASTLDATTLGLAGALAFWYFAVSPRLAQPMSFHLVTTGLVFPVFDLLLLVVASRLVTSPSRRSFAFVMVVFALAASIVNDFWYAVTTTSDIYEWGGVGDMFWVIPSSSIGVAALHPSMASLGAGQQRADFTFTWPRVFLVGLGSVAAPLIVAGTALHTGRLDEEWPALLIGSALLSVAGVARSAEMVRELRLRTEELQSLTARLQESLTRSQELQSELQESSVRDPLTGLGNRRLYQQRLDQAEHGQHKSYTVMFIDIDDFKDINDSLGHTVGDLVLIELAERLQKSVRPSDTVVRLGGDEFVILLQDCDHELASAVGERVLRSIAQPVQVAGRRLHTHASIGVAATRSGEDRHDAFRDADIAMYAAKDAGKNRLIWFEAQMGHSVVDRVQLRSDLRSAIEHGKISVAYQPIVSLTNGRINGVEALARWHHPVRGDIPPSRFIPLAETSGLIADLGRQVLLTAAEQVRRWNDNGLELRLAVNVSALQLSDPNFVADVQQATNLMGGERRLVLELTESALIGDAGQVDLLGRLRDLGCLIAIDDFGTGFSSLAYLRRLPIDIVKIDRSFVADLHRGPEAASLVAAILGLGETFGYTVIAEGIEREETAIALRRHGCSLGQGFLYSRPLAPGELETALTAPSLSA